jgi:hypothetical protein
LKDLITLTACKNGQFAINGILSRHQSLDIKPVSADVFIHPERDPGCARNCVEFLRSQSKRYNHAIVLFDFEGSGITDQNEIELAQKLKERLRTSGWDDRAEVVIISPELENWVWSNSPQVEEILGWSGRIPVLRSWLLERGFLENVRQQKPVRPKEALEAALFEVDCKRSSSIYLRLAKAVSLQHCTDPSFLLLKQSLQRWFPA